MADPRLDAISHARSHGEISSFSFLLSSDAFWHARCHTEFFFFSFFLRCDLAFFLQSLWILPPFTPPSPSAFCILSSFSHSSSFFPLLFDFLGLLLTLSLNSSSKRGLYPYRMEGIRVWWDRCCSGRKLDASCRHCEDENAERRIFPFLSSGMVHSFSRVFFKKTWDVCYVDSQFVSTSLSAIFFL